jgi:hypothetical protein
LSIICGIAGSIAGDMASSIGGNMTEEKVRENRLRRMAERQGLRLEKSRRRDPRALDYGSYALFDLETGDAKAGAVAGERLPRQRFTLDDVEAYLTTDRHDG